MKDCRDKQEIQKQVSDEKNNLPEGKESINVRFAIAIEELCSDDFSFDDEINNSTINDAEKK